jgi:hypothetical protein
MAGIEGGRYQPPQQKEAAFNTSPPGGRGGGGMVPPSGQSETDAGQKKKYQAVSLVWPITVRKDLRGSPPLIGRDRRQAAPEAEEERVLTPAYREYKRYRELVQGFMKKLPQRVYHLDLGRVTLTDL